MSIINLKMDSKTKSLLFIILVLCSMLAYYVREVHYNETTCDFMIYQGDYSDEISFCLVENNRTKRYIQEDEMKECSFPDKEYLNMTTLYKTVNGTILIQEVIASITAPYRTKNNVFRAIFPEESYEQMQKLNAYGYGQPAFERIENWGKIKVKDQKGHLVARRLGGENDHVFNMSPQKQNLNQPNELYVVKGQNHGKDWKLELIKEV